MRLPALLLAPLLIASAPAQPSGAPPPPKRIPVPGITLTDTERHELAAGAAALRRDLDALAVELAGEPRWRALLPDVEIFHKAVDWALRYDEFMAAKDVAYARTQLARGGERLRQLRARQAPWLTATGFVLRGHRSQLDDSIQPYALYVPETLPRRTDATPLLVWLLGRGEKRTELAFMAEREAAPPQLTPRDTLLLVPYGRFCNATKFAGEVDVMEALAAVRAQYRVDSNRIAVAGFSMGGGSTWHLATHHPGLWAVASPGAGFAETPIFTKADAPNKEPRPDWERRLWRHYEATGIAGNLLHLPTLAYAGELDGQKEASDLMAAAMQREGLQLERFIGPQTAHKYHDATKAILTARLEAELAQGREPQPREVRFQTYTLRYPESAWVRLEALGQHWERAEVHARREDDGRLVAQTRNVDAIAFPGITAARVRLDGQDLAPTGPELRFHRAGDRWQPGPASGLRKRPGLTGPVDDAFFASFLFVRPTGRPFHPAVGAWVEAELTAARQLWRDVFRGDVRIKADREITDADLAAHNLVIWGDPGSNALLARVLPQLPLAWNRATLAFRGQTYPAEQHAPILVFPNPLNPARYVVLNSGIDFRADGYGNNALQTPKLPDWAVIDLRTAPGTRWPGRIAAAGFFDEHWK